jgi:hypothetical protein
VKKLDHERRNQQARRSEERRRAHHQDTRDGWRRIEELEQARLQSLVEQFDHPFYIRLRGQQRYSRHQGAVIMRIAAEQGFKVTS